MKINPNAKKINKKTALDYVIALKKFNRITEEQIDCLILYFAPAVPKKPTSAEQWVARAVGKDATRENLNYLYVSGGVMHATDGHRLHMAETSFPDGWYEPRTMMPIRYDGQFPPVDSVIPKREKCEAVKVCDLEDHAIDALGSVTPQKRTGERAINAKYLAEALNGDTSGEVYIAPNEGPWAGDSEYGQWACMGMRIGRED